MLVFAACGFRAVKSQTVPGNEFRLGLCLALHVFIIMAHLNREDCLLRFVFHLNLFSPIEFSNSPVYKHKATLPAHESKASSIRQKRGLNLRPLESSLL